MKKALPIIVFCLKAAIAVFLIFALLFVFLNYALAGQSATIGNFTLKVGNYGVNPVWLADPNYTAMDDLYAALDRGDPQSYVEVAVAMYREALTRLSLAEKYSFRCLGRISFEAAGLAGDVVNTQIKSVERLKTPTLDPYQPSRIYYQNVVTAANLQASGFVYDVMESAITKALREYSDADDISREISSKNVFIDEAGGGATYAGSYKTLTLEEDRKGKRQYDEDELLEISNLIINEDSVLEGSVSIDRGTETGNDGTEQGFYTVSFSLDCSNPTSKGSAVYYEAESIRTQVGDTFLKTLAYTEAALTLKIYDTGYLTEWSMTDNWEAVFNAVLFEINGGAKMSQEQTISYHPDDCEIVDFTRKAA